MLNIHPPFLLLLIFLIWKSPHEPAKKNTGFPEISSSLKKTTMGSSALKKMESLRGFFSYIGEKH